VPSSFATAAALFPPEAEQDGEFFPVATPRGNAEDGRPGFTRSLADKPFSKRFPMVEGFQWRESTGPRKFAAVRLGCGSRSDKEKKKNKKSGAREGIEGSPVAGQIPKTSGFGQGGYAKDGATPPRSGRAFPYHSKEAGAEVNSPGKDDRRSDVPRISFGTTALQSALVMRVVFASSLPRKRWGRDVKAIWWQPVHRPSLEKPS